MKILTLCLAALASTHAAAQDLPANRTLLEEIRGLRIELLEERIERRDERIAGLERQLAEAQAERQRIAEAQRAQNEEIAEFDQRLASPGLPAEDRAEVERLRSQWTSAAASRVAEQAVSASRRESELRAQLAREQQSRRQLQEALRAMGGVTPTNQ
jgi:colicin import membrane protein